LRFAEQLRRRGRGSIHRGVLAPNRRYEHEDKAEDVPTRAE